MLRAISKAVKAQFNWWKNRKAFGAQRRLQELRASNMAVALACTGALRRQA